MKAEVPGPRPSQFLTMADMAGMGGTADMAPWIMAP